MAKPKAAAKVAVSERALFQRINRRLKQDDQMLRTARGFWQGSNWYPNVDLGRYYTIDTQRNFIVDRQVDLEELGRELKVLAEWEALKAD